MSKSGRFVAVVFVLVLASAAVGAEFEQKWVFLSCNLRTPEGVDKALEILDISAAGGCNYALVTDSSHLYALEMGQEYFNGIAKVKEKAASLGITLIPTIFPSGYGGRYLNFDKNYAAGIPVKDAPFVVKGIKATPDPNAVPAILNGGFEDVKEGVFEGWEGQEAAGESVSADPGTVHEGKVSLKFGNFPAAPERGSGPPQGGPAAFAQRRAPIGLTQTIAVAPFRQYRLSFWLKTDAWTGRGAPSVGVSSSEGRRRHIFKDLEVEPTQDWKEYTLFFNTLDASEIQLSVNARGSEGATAWFDGIEVKPVGLLNVIRRNQTPVKVTSADGSVAYEEGKDFERIADPFLDPYEITHDEPALMIVRESRISDGDTVLVSWYHPMLIYVDQVNITISDPAIFEMMDRDMRLASMVWEAPGYFMNVDEIRVAGWEEGEKRPGEMLADYTEKAVAIIRKYAPEADAYVWSDMYTPFHNARPISERGYYYLVNGGWDGSWEKLPPEVIIMTWSARNEEAMKWFSDRGHKQVVCGYYDGDMKRNITRWMTVSENVPDVIGMMYTTWTANYDNLVEFFELVKTYPAWVSAPEARGAGEQ